MRRQSIVVDHTVQWCPEPRHATPTTRPCSAVPHEARVHVDPIAAVPHLDRIERWPVGSSAPSRKARYGPPISPRTQTPESAGGSRRPSSRGSSRSLALGLPPGGSTSIAGTAHALDQGCGDDRDRSVNHLQRLAIGAGGPQCSGGVRRADSKRAVTLGSIAPGRMVAH